MQVHFAERPDTRLSGQVIGAFLVLAIVTLAAVAGTGIVGGCWP